MEVDCAIKVLVVDDSATVLHRAQSLLVQAGYEVLLASDGFDALAKVHDYQPDVLFCDISMPRLDGYQTCALIKRNPHFCDLPVLLLSAHDGLMDQARARLAGAQGYLNKPFTQQQLVQAVQQFTATVQGASHAD